MRVFILVCLSFLALINLYAQKSKFNIIDVHVHAPLGPGEVKGKEMIESQNWTIKNMDSLNISFGVLNGLPEFFEPWNKAAPGRFMNFLLFPCVDGKAPNGGRPCFANGKSFPDIKWLREQIEAGKIQGLGEITAEYIGMPPNDPALEPYWALAEEFDIPVCIHMGLGPPNAAYPSSPATYKSPNFKGSAGNPLLLEDVLLKHKNLRVWVMHAGWPLLEEMILLLHLHPNVNVDTGVLQWLPRKEYYYNLKRLVDAGYSKRIMFGSDGNMKEGVNAILQADFLSNQEKEDILYNNAVKFLRLIK